MNNKSTIRIITSLLVILIGLSTSAGGGGGRWKTIRVDAGKTFRAVTNSSLKLYNGVPSVAYGADHLYYATQVGDVFTSTTVDDDWGVGMYASLAINPTNGYPTISYYDQTHDQLMYAEYLGSPVWNILMIDTGGNKSAIALDHSSRHLPHIAYTHPDGTIWHAWVSCGVVFCEWNTPEEVDSTVKADGTNIAFEIDNADHLHMAYYDAKTISLHYAYHDGINWTHYKVPDTTGVTYYGLEPSLAIDADNYPGIVYTAESTINYTWKTGSGQTQWTSEILYSNPSAPKSPTAPSLQLPNDDLTQPWISFIDAYSYVRLAVFGEGTCPGTTGDYDCEIIDFSSDFRDLTSLIVDTSDTSYNLGRLVYIDKKTGELRYNEQSTSGTWDHQAVDFTSNTGLSSSLVFDADGSHIFYYDRGNTTFRYAELDAVTPGGCGAYGTTNWFRCEVVDDDADVDSFVSGGIGYDNKPHMAYYNPGRPALRYATLDTSWSSEIIDGDPDSNDYGQYASLAFDPATGYARIAYLDVSHQYVKFAKELPSPYTGGNCGPSNTWHCENVESVNTGGSGISLAINPSGSVLISFMDGDDNLVKVARYPSLAATLCSNTTWGCESIAPAYPSRWGQTSIWAGSTGGIILVSFFSSDIDDGILVESTYSYASGWVPSVVDRSYYAGEENSITGLVTTSDVIPYIAYTDGDNLDLKLAAPAILGTGNCGNGPPYYWSCQTLDSAGWVGFDPSININDGRLSISYYDYSNGDLKLIFQAFPTFAPIIKRP